MTSTKELSSNSKEIMDHSKRDLMWTLSLLISILLVKKCHFLSPQIPKHKGATVHTFFHHLSNTAQTNPATSLTVPGNTHHHLNNASKRSQTNQALTLWIRMWFVVPIYSGIKQICLPKATPFMSSFKVRIFSQVASWLKKYTLGRVLPPPPP